MPPKASILLRSYKERKCKQCDYYYVCLGITDASVRRSCHSRKHSGTYYGEDEPPRWGEMSYYRLRPKSDTERIKKGE